ncbi:MAG: hypothetical protein AAF802_12560 [Planctomycetota bacterium]
MPRFLETTAASLDYCPNRVKKRHNYLFGKPLSDHQVRFEVLPIWRPTSDITLQQVISPILGEARSLIPQACQESVLVACDWCNLHYKDHHGKKGRIALANSKDLGYEMFSGLAMDDRDGRPIAPLWIELCDQAGIHSTRDHQIRPAGSVLDEIAGRIGPLERSSDGSRSSLDRSIAAGRTLDPLVA